MNQYTTIDETGYIQYYQFITDEYIRLTPTIWTMMGLAYSNKGLSSQFRIDLSWNTEYCSLKQYDLFVQKLNFAFENESNNEKKYRIIVNTLRLIFDDWYLGYNLTNQRCPSPLFISENNIYEAVKVPGYYQKKSIVEIDPRTKLPIKKDVSEYIEPVTNYTYYNPRCDINGNDTYSLMDDDKRRICLKSFLRGVLFGLYSPKLSSQFTSTNEITLELYSNSFACSLHQLLSDYNITSYYDYFDKNNIITIKNSDNFLDEILDFESGINDEFEPPILIKSPRRGV